MGLFGPAIGFYLSILKDKQMLPHGRCHDLENGGSSYSISQSISRFTETQVGINRRDNDNNELHDLDRQLLDINPVKSDQRMKPRTVG